MQRRDAGNPGTLAARQALDQVFALQVIKVTDFNAFGGLALPVQARNRSPVSHRVLLESIRISRFNVLIIRLADIAFHADHKFVIVRFRSRNSTKIIQQGLLLN